MTREVQSFRPTPAVVRAFRLELRAFASTVLVLPPVERLRALRGWLVALRSSGVFTAESEARALAEMRDALRRERGLLVIARLAKLPRRRCSVCSWPIRDTGPEVCKPCRLRLIETEGADPAQQSFSFVQSATIMAAASVAARGTVKP